MTHGSLFSGIGGFDLAAEWMGWENVFHCEWNPFGQKILKHYWPNAKSYEDITKSDFTQFRGAIDIITGGFPCQPFSTAGKRKGTEDSRYLWPEMLRVIREVQPRYIVGENVRGLVSWDGGLVFDTVCSDLEAEGYEVLPVLLPAASLNAPHKRDRIWFIANRKTNGLAKSTIINQRAECKPYNGSEIWNPFNTNGTSWTSINSNNTEGSDGLGQVQSKNGKISERNNDAELSDSGNWNAPDTMCNGSNESRERGQSEKFDKNGIEKRITSNSKNFRRKDALENGELERRRFRQSNKRNAWNSFPSVSPICNGDDGLSDRLDGITFSKWRKESIKGGGNAIVPQVAFQIFKTIEQCEHFSSTASKA